MADDNIKDFTLKWVLAGVLVFSLLTFALVFVYNNNSSALGENEEQLRIITSNFSESLVEIEENIDVQMNSSAQLSSEDTSVGSTSASSTSYNLFGETQSSWTNFKIMLAWIFAGSFGTIVAVILGGILGITGLYYVIKLLRSLF